MTKEVYDATLVIDDELEQKISITEVEKLKPIQKKFMNSYLENKDEIPLEQWLNSEMSENLPEYSDKDIKEMSNEIITTLKIQEDKKFSLGKAFQEGKSKEYWFANETKIAISQMSSQDVAKYLQNLDDALVSTNESLYRTIHTQSGIISQNPNLDGFIAEQYHAQTFNLNAEAIGSQYRAKVLEPIGNGYAKNSVDIVIVDGNNKVVRRYQAKYCKDANATARAFEHGDYRGQQKLVPEGQETEITKKTTTVLEAPDGTTSNTLTKSQAKDFQKEAQSGKWNELNWNEYQVKDLAIDIGQQAGESAILGAVIGGGFNLAKQVWNGEEIDGSEMVETALLSGTDFGIKAAAAGALKVGVEKGIVTAIPKGTPAGTIASVVHVAVENVKVIGKMATGELTAKEGFEKMEQTTVSTVAGITTAAEGAAFGATVGIVLGPIGTAIGGFIGGTVGYMAGSKTGETITKGVQKVRNAAVEVVKTIGSGVKKFVSSVASGVKSFCSGIKSILRF